MTTLTRTQRALCSAVDQHLHTIRRQRVATRSVVGCTLSDADLADRLGVTARTAHDYRRNLHSEGVLQRVRVKCSDGTALVDATTRSSPTSAVDLPEVIRLGDRLWRVATDTTSPSVSTFLVDGDPLHLEPVGHVNSVEGQAALRAAADRTLTSTAGSDCTHTPGSTRPKGRSAVRKTFPTGWVR